MVVAQVVITQVHNHLMDNQEVLVAEEAHLVVAILAEVLLKVPVMALQVATDTAAGQAEAVAVPAAEEAMLLAVQLVDQEVQAVQVLIQEVQ
jgi:hypothetical protein